MVIAALDAHVKFGLDYFAEEVEKNLEADLVTIYSPIVPGLEKAVDNALHGFTSRKDKLVVVLDTTGGSVEVVDRMVDCIRNFYKEVVFLIPDKAMSAGTVFVMSGDRIMMNYYSVLGPIDPQVQKDGKWIPALSYLEKFEELVQRSSSQPLTIAELTLLQKMDLAELHTFEQAREISNTLLEKWLSQYKFKDWTETETKKLPVTLEMKKVRAKEVANQLNDIKKWHSHSRGINMDTLRNEIKLKIEDFDENEVLKRNVKNYFDLLANYVTQKGFSSFIHSRFYF